jgi:Acetyltransferase (GNAT) domain
MNADEVSGGAGTTSTTPVTHAEGGATSTQLPCAGAHAPADAAETERITVVPLADEHLEWEVELDSDFEVMRYLSGRARELVRYGFDDVGLDRIIAQTMAVNRGSRAVMERVGLTYVRTFPTSRTASMEGLEEGEVEYEMTHEQWERLRPNSRR